MCHPPTLPLPPRFSVSCLHPIHTRGCWATAGGWKGLSVLPVRDPPSAPPRPALAPAPTNPQQEVPESRGDTPNRPHPRPEPSWRSSRSPLEVSTWCVCVSKRRTASLEPWRTSAWPPVAASRDAALSNFSTSAILRGCASILSRADRNAYCYVLWCLRFVGVMQGLGFRGLAGALSPCHASTAGVCQQSQN